MNDDSDLFSVTGDTVQVPLRGRGFAGENLTLILPADRDEVSKPGVWSILGNPIYQPEIETYLVSAIAGTGHWVRASDFASFFVDQYENNLALDYDRDGDVDLANVGTDATNEIGMGTWERSLRQHFLQ